MKPPQPQSLKAVVGHARGHSQTHRGCPPICQHAEQDAAMLLATLNQWIEADDNATRDHVAVILDLVADELDGGDL